MFRSRHAETTDSLSLLVLCASTQNCVTFSNAYLYKIPMAWFFSRCFYLRSSQSSEPKRCSWHLVFYSHHKSRKLKKMANVEDRLKASKAKISISGVDSKACLMLLTLSLLDSRHLTSPWRLKMRSFLFILSRGLGFVKNMLWSCFSE